MKILHVIPTLGSGGAERFVVDLCNEQIRRGHEVGICLFFSCPEDDPLNFYLDELASKVSIFTTDKQLGFDLRIFKRINTVIKNFKPDIVHSHLRALIYLLPAALIFRDINFFHTIHNDAVREAGDRLNSLVRKFLFKQGFVHPVTISNTSDESFVKYYGKDYYHTLIYNGAIKKNADAHRATEIIEAQQSGRKKILVNIARIMPQKNQLALVNAMKQHPDVELYMVGNDEGEYANEVRKVMPPNCHILGTRKNPLDYLAAADAFILPSAYEGMPISLIEAFSIGAIPIVSAVGGMKDMIQNGINGILINNPSSKGIADSIQYFFDLSENRKRELRVESEKSFKQYDMATCNSSYEALYKLKK